MFNAESFARVAIAAVGAIVLSTLSITAAVGPVHAAGIVTHVATHSDGAHA